MRWGKETHLFMLFGKSYRPRIGSEFRVSFQRLAHVVANKPRHRGATQKHPSHESLKLMWSCQAPLLSIPRNQRLDHVCHRLCLAQSGAGPPVSSLQYTEKTSFVHGKQIQRLLKRAYRQRVAGVASTCMPDEHGHQRQHQTPHVMELTPFLKMVVTTFVLVRRTKDLLLELSQRK